MVDIDPLSLDAQTEQSVALGGEVLLIGGASGVPDKQRAHGAPPELGPAVPQNAAASGIGQRPTPPPSASDHHARKADIQVRCGIAERTLPALVEMRHMAPRSE